MTTLRTLTFLTLLLLSQVLVTVGTDCKLPRGYVEYPEDRTAYRFHREKLTWELARERCFSEDADLAVVTSRQKMMHILNHLQIPSNSALFIGVHRLTPSSDWVRADTGLPVTSIPWTEFTTDAEYNCAAIWTKDAGIISNFPCSWTRSFFCEISIADACPDLVGPRGPPGFDGARGSPGVSGPKGEKGQSGEQGLPGLTGLDGSSGDKGSTGDAGAPGPQGPIGPTGTAGDLGSVGPRGPEGAKGEPGVSGIVGRPGEDGIDGIPGPEGPPGPEGLAGLPGFDGKRGPIGPPGPRGPVGPRGLPSLPGKPGLDGEPGPPGPAGPPGDQGFPGVDGAPGTKGEKGLDGTDGKQGLPGPGYNATWFSLLAACQEQSQRSSLIDGGESPTGFGNDSLVKQKCEEFIAGAYEQMWVSFQNFIEPKVHKEFTAKTCRDLFIADPDKPSGEYLINPSDDDTRDKILVYCDAEKRSTCISPVVNQSQVITYEGEEQEVWLSEHEMGFQISYTAVSRQINALQLLSSHAEQNVTYHCMKSVGYFDAAGRIYGRGLKLSTWNGAELNPRGRQSLRYEMISDECQNRTNDWRDTVITYRTDRPVLLPILDVALRDLGKPEKKAIVEIGDVCFS